MNRHHRSAFTLIELLVVIAVIAVLVSLLMPAVQQAREAARRTSCSSNLRQIGMAITLYHDTNNVFPHTDAGGSISRASAFTAILPYLEQGAAYDHYNFSLGNSDPVNKAAVSQTIPVYLCPSATIPRVIPIPDCDANDRAPGTYAVCTGSGDPWGTVIGGNPHNGAIVGSGSGRTGMRDLLDGATQTLLVGESDWNMPDYLFTSGPCQGQTRWGFTYWSSPYPLATAFSTKGPFNPKALNGDSTRLSNFRSDHPGIVQFCMADGSVHPLNESIDHNLLDALATRAGSEPVSKF